ncbi:hypothetical protein ACFQV4_25780 [Streptomyces thermocarboxydus]
MPVHPDTNAWLVSGNLTTYPRGDGPQLAQLAVQTLTAHPQLLRRNPQMLRKAWEMQAEARADFIEVFGTDLLVLDAYEAPNGCGSTTDTGRTRRWPDSTTKPPPRRSTPRPLSTGSAVCPKNSATRTPSP